MAVDIKVPSVGESITEGTVARWFKKDGETVRADEPLFELETEKATTEIVAPASGTVRIQAQEGQKVAIGAVVGQIEAGSGAPANAKSAPAAKPSPPAPAPAAKQSEPAAPILMPAARRVAEEKGVATEQLTGTGRDGRITKEDVEQAAASGGRKPPEGQAAPEAGIPSGGSRPPLAETPAPAPRTKERETRQRMSSIRQRISERLVAAQKSTASLTTFNEADLSAVMALRSQYKESFQKKHGVGLGFMSFFVKAAVEALKAFPVVNGRIDGTDVIYNNYYDIGIAVSSERGLMVPVLRDADALSFSGIEKAIAALAQKARDGKIALQELQGGTFTITNGGIFGSLLSTPILNPPQSAILGMHTIQKRPVAVNDQVVIRPMMYLALTYDHRLIDGREAVQFLVRIKECLESPERLLLEV